MDFLFRQNCKSKKGYRRKVNKAKVERHGWGGGVFCLGRLSERNFDPCNNMEEKAWLETKYYKIHHY